MKKQEIKKLIASAVDEDQDLTGLLVYNLKTSEIIASTFDDDYAKNSIKIQRLYRDTELKAVGLEESAGGCNWVLKSLARKIIYDIKISENVYIFGETKITESPTSAIEDGLELALMVSRLL